MISELEQLHRDLHVAQQALLNTPRSERSIQKALIINLEENISRVRTSLRSRQEVEEVNRLLAVEELQAQWGLGIEEAQTILDKHNHDKVGLTNVSKSCYVHQDIIAQERAIAALVAGITDDGEERSDRLVVDPVRPYYDASTVRVCAADTFLHKRVSVSVWS